MKSLIVLSLLFSSAAMAEAHREVVSIEANTNIYNLSCKINLGTPNTAVKDRTYTILSAQAAGKPLQIIGDTSAIKLTHTLAQVQGCQIEKLDKIVNDGSMYYGFPLTPITVIKETSESRLNGYNECIATFTETLKIDLGRGIVVESVASRWVKATDCKSQE